jgi:hypothetical protein
MKLNFCVRWPQQIVNGADHFRFSILDLRFARLNARIRQRSTIADRADWQFAIGNWQF